MNMQMRLLASVMSFACLLITENALAINSLWAVTVFNDTPLSIRARCKKVGALKADWEIILPNKSAECKCGGADCSNGVEVEIPMGPQNVLKLETNWQIHCGNDEVRVVPVPVWDIKKNGDKVDFKLKGFKIGIGSSFEMPKNQPLQPYNG